LSYSPVLWRPGGSTCAMHGGQKCPIKKS